MYLKPEEYLNPYMILVLKRFKLFLVGSIRFCLRLMSSLTALTVIWSWAMAIIKAKT